MTVLEFISATIGQLAWPVLIVVVFFVLKDPLKKIATSPRLTRLKAGPSGFEVEFKEELGDVEQKLQASIPGESIGSDSSGEVIATDFISEMNRLAEVSPRSVVMEAHVRLEKLLRLSVESVPDAKPPRYPTMGSLVQTAVQQRLLAPQEASALNELTYLRNRVAHEPDEVITPETAIRYAEVAKQVAIAIRLAMGQTIADGQSPL